jgi:hypothetical protein
VNRIILSSLLALILLVGLLAGYIYFLDYKNENAKPENAIPPDATFFVKGKISQALDDIQTTDYWKQADKSKWLSQLKSNILFFDSLLKNNTSENNLSADLNATLVSFHVTGSDKFDALYIVPVKSKQSLKNVEEMLVKRNSDSKEITSRQFDGVEIFELPFAGDKIFAYAFSHGLIIGSFTPFLVEDAIRQQRLGKPFEGDASFEKTFQQAYSDSLYKLCVNYKGLKKMFAGFLSDENDAKLNGLEKFAGWLFLNIKFQKTSIECSGTIYNSDSSNYISILKNNTPAQLEVTNVLPENTAAFSAYIVDDLRNYLLFQQKEIASSPDLKKISDGLGAFEKAVKIAVRKKTLELFSGEIVIATTESSIENGSNKLAFCRIKNSAKTKSFLRALSILKSDKKQAAKGSVEKYNEYEIGYIPVEGLLPSLFGNDFISFKKTFYIVSKNYLVVSSRASLLRNYISEISDKKLFTSSESYLNCKEQLNQKGNYFLFVDPEKCMPIAKAIINQNRMKWMEDNKMFIESWNSFVFGISSGAKQLECRMTFTYNSKSTANILHESFTYESDTRLITVPYCFSDSLHHADILFEDAGMNLCCVSEQGILKWKKNIEEKITGNIYRVDMLLNGTPQFLFATSSKIYIVDNAGSPIGNYPIKLPAMPVTGISVYPALNPTSYFIACNNRRIYSYDLAGKPMIGWEFISTDNNLKTDISIAPKQKLIYWIDQSMELYIYTIDGNKLLKAKLKQPVVNDNLNVVTKSDSSVALTGCDSTGSVFAYYLNGTVSVKSTDNHGSLVNYFEEDLNADSASEKIFVNKNAVYIYSSDYGLKGKYITKQDINLAYIVSVDGRKKIIAYTLANDSKIYAIDGNAKPVKGFPIEGEVMGKCTPNICNIILLGKEKTIRLFSFGE